MTRWSVWRDSLNEVISTKEKILQAALIEFGQKGYNGASTNKIKDRAKVSKGLIFNYFESKSMLFYEVFSGALKRLLAALEELEFHPDKPVYERIMDIVLFKVIYAKKYPYDSQCLIEAFKNPQPEWQDKMKETVVVMTKMSLDHVILEKDMLEFSSSYTREDVIRNITIATSGLQEMYVNENLSLEYLENVREEALSFLKIVIEGMKDK